jgi:radical SAM protein with 4Fe4S-binding SPASM domain
VEKIVIFGAGNVGRMVLEKNKNRVAYFIDNDVQLHGRTIDGIVIKSVEDFIQDKDKYQLVIASYSQKMIEQQVIEMGVKNYRLFLNDIHGYYLTDELIFNPYKDNIMRNLTESRYNEITKNNLMADTINEEVERLYSNNPMFRHVEIETVNRCNGKCSFCPISVGNDNRKYKYMSDQLFENIINQLSELNYSGKLALFSNNEPFLDKKIVNRHKYAREKVPKARMHLFTNGTLLTVELFQEIIQYLDEMVIDNYDSDLKLIDPCKKISEYCDDHPELKKKVTIVLRNPNEILSNRGGDAPNRSDTVYLENVKCVLPFRQIIIRPDGKLSLCCCDPLGKNTMGDLNKETLIDIWQGSAYKKVREALYMGRKYWPHCSKCDYLGLA